MVGSDTHLFFFSFRAGRYDSTDRHCKNCVGFFQINRGNRGAVPVVITRAQYNAIQTHRMALAAREGETQPTDQSTEQANHVFRSTTLADVFKDGLPSWFPDFNHQDESNDSESVMDATAQLPTNTKSVPPVPIANHVEQPPLDEPSLFELERVDGYAEAFKNGFPVIDHEGESNVSDAIVDTSAQLSTISASDPVANHLEQPFLYQPSLFHPDSTDECAEAFKNGFPAICHEGEPTMSLPVPVVNHSEQRPSFYMPSLFSLEGVDEWSTFSDLLQS